MFCYPLKLKGRSRDQFANVNSVTPGIEHDFTMGV